MGTDVAVYDGETGELELATDMALAEARRRAEITAAIEGAQRFPRNYERFLEDAGFLACLSPEIAASCSYAKPQGGKLVVGPSIRLAEIAYSAWGRISIDWRLISQTKRQVTVLAVGFDRQNLNEFFHRETRRITDRFGNTYSEDLTLTTIKAAAAIARRTVIQNLIPGALIEQVRLRAVAKANEKHTLDELVVKLLAHFAGIGVEEQRVLQSAGVTRRADLSLEHIETLRAVATAIRDGDWTIEEAFPQTQSERMAEKMAGGKAKAEPSPKAT